MRWDEKAAPPQASQGITIGIDLGDRVSVACVLGQEAEVLERTKFRTDREGLDRFLSGRPSCRVVIEAGGHSRWVTAELARRGYEVVVANPRAVKLITQSKKKNDRRDAETLARLGRADVKLLSPIQHRSETAQRDLTRIQARDGLVRSRTQLINEVRGSAKAAGYRLPKCSAATFHNVAAKLPDDLRLALGLLIDGFALLNGLIRKADKELREATARHPDAKRLKTVDRVGPITALAYVMILEDPARFAGHRREVASFVGLVPRQPRESKPPHPGDCGPVLEPLART